MGNGPRRTPEVLKPDEFQVAVALAQLQAFQFELDARGRPDRVWVIKDARPGGPGGAAPGNLGVFGAIGGPGPGLPGGGPRPGPMGGALGVPPGGGLPPGGPPGEPPPDGKTRAELVKITDAEANAHRWTLATRVLPQRMVIVAASFPYRKQVDEFRTKLSLGSHDQVLSGEIEGDNRARLAQFQFLGLEVERAVVVPGQKTPIWRRLDLKADFLPVFRATGLMADGEGGDLGPMAPMGIRGDGLLPGNEFLTPASRGLVMPLPRQFRSGGYPDLFARLENVKKTVTRLKEAPFALPPQSRYTPPSNEIDLFDPLFEAANRGPAGMGMPTTPPGIGFPRPPGPGEGGGVPGIPGPPPAGVPGGAGGPQGPGFPAGPGAAATSTPIDHCLLRFIDVTVQPGQSYRYRVRVKMRNPTYLARAQDRREGDTVNTRDPEIVSEWQDVDRTVVMPPEEAVYAVDQKLVDPKSVDPKLLRTFVEPSTTQVALQLQRWVDFYRPNPAREEKYGVGEWLVFPRLLVERGEYVRTCYETTKEGQGINPQTEVPIKSLHSTTFELMSRTDVRGRTPLPPTLIPVRFGGEQPEKDSAVLVDFERGPARHTRLDGQTIQDGDGTEVLLLRPDGRVVVKTSATDHEDPERVIRYKTYLDRIKEIKDRDRPLGSPFGPPGFPE